MKISEKIKAQKIKAHFDIAENCYDVERSWIGGISDSGIEVIMIEYRGDHDSIIVWREVSEDFGKFQIGTVADLMKLHK